MPVTGPNSYPSTIGAFLSHWADVNTLLGTPLTIIGGRTVANLQQWLQDSTDQIAATTQAIITAANRKAELDQIKANLVRWTVKFNDTLRTDHPALTYIKNLVPAPKLSAGRGSFTGPLAQTLQIWLDANAVLTPDVTLTIRTLLSNGTTQVETLEAAEYQDLLNDLSSKWTEWVMAQQKSDNVRETRNDTHKLAYDCMRDYRAKVQNELAPGHALLESLPLLNPDTSKNPDAPEATGAWNAATEKADLSGTPSTSATVVRHEVRYSPEPEYNPENEIVLATIPTGQPLTYSTDIGLGIVGDVSRFQVVAVTGDGHEGRSPVVAVERTS
jgi:hypothetical protein